jgi:hypothetical protein
MGPVFTENFDDFYNFVFNLITCIRTVSQSTDVQHITSLHEIATCNGSVVLEIVLKIPNCISHLKMARRGRNMQ